MYSITHISLVSYMTRVLKDIVSRNPRFRRALGDVSIVSNNAIYFGDLQVIIKDISTDPTRLSPDYYMDTQSGRAILTQIEDKDGAFIEWVREVDTSLTTPAAGVYYLNVNCVDEKTQDVSLTLQTYKWYEGVIKNAYGSPLVFRTGIDPHTLTVVDATYNYNLTLGDTVTLWESYADGHTPPPAAAHLSDTVPPADSILFFSKIRAVPPKTQPLQNLIYLLTNVNHLEIYDANNTLLVPNVDYWVQARQSQVVASNTPVGTQAVQIPAQFTSLSLMDQDGYCLTPGKDYKFQPNFNPDGTFNGGMSQLSAWTGYGTTITAVGDVRLDPTVPGNLMNPENTFGFTVLPTETLVKDQVFVSTQEADHIPVTVNADGTVTLPAPLPPGGWCRWEARVLVGQTVVKAQKNKVNTNIIPGLRIAIGDVCVPGDQCAIVVSPVVTETYEVYGSKPGVTFTLDVKANDPTTADEISKMILQELLVKRRINLEVDGLTIYEASSQFSAAQRDDSGTAPTYKVSLSVTGAADWRIYMPLVTRVVGFSISTEPYIQYPGKMSIKPRYASHAAHGFLPDYR